MSSIPVPKDHSRPLPVVWAPYNCYYVKNANGFNPCSSVILASLERCEMSFTTNKRSYKIREVALTKHRSVVTEAILVVTARITIPHALVSES